ncbi:gliding motility-associated C-terminal domain-containing protein [Taibaiella chishuiensis]|uniref:Gliding motility-associated-like protein n=1 Tax=Taibaiella chishuiensis TaxID=1434707 RepID=A0A2P8DCW4_9BACT|nr:gliding motility-associated C-terminal domain-containing protein [Taibaiella chishuiensis]PSK95060.1 gliding motility-associated-like protein [Taibaiella chishuiensis]
MKTARHLFLFVLLHLTGLVQAQDGPPVWVFGKNAGLDFKSGQAQPVTFPIDNHYSPSSSQTDPAGNLLFYCDGRDIKDRNGQVMPGSQNPVWQPPVHIVRKITSNIVPVPGDANRYYVFILSPSSGEPPFGTYYSGVLTYSIVDMRLNNGLGGVDPAFSNILVNTELDTDMLVVPASDCSYWLIAYRRAPNTAGQFLAYRLSATGIAPPVTSSVSLAGFPYPFHNMDLIYAYRHNKIVGWIGGRLLIMMDFNPGSGVVSNAWQLQDLSEFRNPGGGITTPSVCLSPNEKFLYILGYPAAVNVPKIMLWQYPVDFSNPALTLPIASASLIFETNNALYQTPSISVPFGSQNCDIRRGPDGRLYIFYNTAQSFLGVVNKPDLAGAATGFDAQGVQLLPNTYGSFWFPSVAAERFTASTHYYKHDTLLCFSAPFVLRPTYRGSQYSYQWSDGSTQSYKEINAPGVYWVKATGSCSDATGIDTFSVSFEPPEKCNCTIFVPNAFSPNQDNLNDIFRPMLPLTCMGGGYRMRIYNRWGETVFESYDLMKGWDGNCKGQPADLGVYYYTIHYRNTKGEEQQYKGDFSLLR